MKVTNTHHTAINGNHSKRRKNRSHFARFVGPVIDKVLGLRCTSFSYQSARLRVLCQVSTSVAATVWRNNGFGWARLPKSFMAENTVFLLLTALIRNFYKFLMDRIDAKAFGLKKTGSSDISSDYHL